MRHLSKITVLLMLTAMCTLTACGAGPSPITEMASEEKANTEALTDFGEPNMHGFIKIKDRLFYEEYTHILHHEYTTYGALHVYIPVIAPNGYPYGYDPETGKLYMTGPDMDPDILAQFE